MNSEAKSPHSVAPIGILDSGMGGVSIWREITRQLPGETLVYWADTAHCPYGGRSREELVGLTDAGVRSLMKYGVKIIVVACNTATTAAISELRTRYPEMIFVGMEPAIKPAVQQTTTGVIAVLATEFTIGSDMYRQTREKYAGQTEIISIVGSGLVELVEQGKERSEEAEILLRRYLGPALERGADQLVLACTHFPLLEHTIRGITGERVEIIDPAPAIARHTRRLLDENGLLRSPEMAPATTENIFLSSAGEAAARQIQEKAYASLSQSTGGDRQ